MRPATCWTPPLLTLLLLAAAVALLAAAAALLAPAAALLAPAAWAQRPELPLAGEPPSAGIHLSAPSLVSGESAASVEVNPGALGLLESWSLLYHHAQLEQDGRVNGAGDALFFGTSLPFLRSVSVGLGLQWLRPPEAIGYRDYAKVSLALAVSPNPAIALGLGYHSFISDNDLALDDLSTVDLGLVLRPVQWLAAGLTVRDLTTPLYAGLPLQRTYELELAGRPLASELLELGLGLRIGERRGDLDPRFRLEARPLPGLRLLGHVEVLQRDFYRDGGSQTDVRATLGFGFDLEQVGLSIAALTGRELAPGPGPLARSPARASYQGLEGSLHLRGTRRAPLVSVQPLIVQLELSGELTAKQQLALARLEQQLRGRRDVRGLLLQLNGLQLGLAQAQELRRWLGRLRQQGIKTYAYLRGASAREYYMAAAAEQVMLDPAGGLNLAGLALQTLYFRDTLEKIGASPQFVRIAEFKSAPEAYLRRGPSPAADEMMRSLLEGLFDQLLQDLARDRGVSAAKLRALIDRGPFIPPLALQEGLIDALIDPAELVSTFEKQTQAKLVKSAALARQPERWPVGPGLAVVLVQGDIIAGKSAEIPLLGRRVVGDETVVKALSWARRDSTVKAILLRVESPGGSAMASDRIWQEVVKTRKVKPVVVSLGNIAASGGYYIAAGGDVIYALPATLTGSIGIFTGKFDLSGLLSKLGINVEVWAAGKRALMDSFDRPYSEEERAFILSRLQYYYRRFLAAVSKGRKLTQDQVHEHARGRVWTGAQARARSLVDVEGGLFEALEEAKRRGGLSPARPARIFLLPEEPSSLLKQAINLLQAPAPAAWELPPALLQLLKALPAVLLHATPGEPLARMPLELVD